MAAQVFDFLTSRSETRDKKALLVLLCFIALFLSVYSSLLTSHHPTHRSISRLMSERRSGRSLDPGKAGALAKLRQLKKEGRKHLDVKEEEPLYDEVDEDEYCDLVVKRQKDDWIVDDGTGGYVEDGREIFDEEHVSSDEDDARRSKARKPASKKHKVTGDSSSASKDKEKKHDIRQMFRAGQHKVQSSSSGSSVQNDELLQSILQDLDIKPKTDSSPRVNPILEKTKREAGLAAAKRSRVSLNTEFEKKIKRPKVKLEDIDSILSTSACENVDTSMEATFDELFKQQDFDMPSSPLTTVEEEVIDHDIQPDGEFLHVYWFEITEFPEVPGKVYLFGKTPLKDQKGKFTTCCIIIPNIEKRLYVLPRVKNGERASLESVENELTSISKKHKMTNFKCRPVLKKYAFDLDYVPREETEYLEVLVPATATIPSDLSGSTFSCVFGWSQTATERVLLDCELRGPGWLKIRNSTQSSPPVTWCRHEYIVSSLDDVVVNTEKVEPIPPVTLVGLTTRTFKNPKTGNNEIVAISCFINHRFNPVVGSSQANYDSHFCLIRTPPGTVLPYDTSSIKLQPFGAKHFKLKFMSSELEMLNFFMAKLVHPDVDPDIFVGHDILDNDLNFIYNRMISLKTSHWSRLGRLRLSTVPKRRDRTSIAIGRLIVDIKASARELIKSQSFDLTELAKTINRTRVDCDLGKVDYWYSSGQLLTAYIDHLLTDNDICMNLLMSMNVIPLAVQITNIAGNSLGKTLLGGRSERNELLLMHAFHEAGYICPDRSIKKTNTDKATTYTGGLVLDPKSDLYSTFVVVLDFNSLYPSIVREFNLCFTTLTADKPDPPNNFASDGILPIEIGKLVETRKQVKQLMEKTQDASEKAVLNIKQTALKLTANSMYGCLGFSSSRFYAAHLAALITAKGRELLVQTKDLVETKGFEVIYGDTDSLMIDTKRTTQADAVRMANDLIKCINGQYHHLVIGLDHVFAKLLLLKKKKYAALVIGADGKCRREYKGLDIVRRDWSTVARNAGDQVLQIILDENAKSEELAEKIHEFLKHLSANLMNKPMRDFLILKQLNKNPNDYGTSAKSLPHVLVAQKFNQECKDGRLLRSGDVVPYLVCKHISDEEFNKLSNQQRAVHPDLKTDDLLIDRDYYLEQQIFPVVSRLLIPIEGTDARSIAEFLGLPGSFAPNVKREVECTIPDPYTPCDPIPIHCPTCKSKLEIREQINKCSKCQEDLRNCSSVAIEFKLYLRKIIAQYYDGWRVCDECSSRERWPLPVRGDRNIRCSSCSDGTMIAEMSSREVYRRFCFAEQMSSPSMLESIRSERKYSTFVNINLKSLFNFYLPKNTL